MKQYAGYIFDLDGTIYRGSRLIPGADAALARLRARGARIIFLSNNPVRDRDRYVEKIRALGISCALEEILNSSYVLTEELKREAPGARLYVVGEASIKRELQAAGFRFAASPEETDIVVLAFDRTFHYGKLAFAHEALKRGAQLWATNPDRACPTDNGDIPDCGAIIAAVETCSGRKLDRMTGKPSATMVRVAAQRLGLPIAQCLIVGDRLETDMLMAREAGCDSALVLTGITSPEMLKDSPIQPTYVLKSVAELA